MTARIADLGGVPMPMEPTEFSRLIAEETEKWGKVIRVSSPTSVLDLGSKYDQPTAD